MRPMMKSTSETDAFNGGLAVLAHASPQGCAGHWLPGSPIGDILLRVANIDAMEGYL
jgi:hypothetical protein